METRFERALGGQVVGRLTTVDRLIIHGHLRHFWYRAGMAEFLDRQGLRIQRDFGRYVHETTERVKAHAERIATRAHRPFIYQEKVVRGKDDLAREIAKKDGITQGLICVFYTLELAKCFALRRRCIVPELRKCLHFYFYLIDRELGFMHVRLQSWFPFQIQIYVNGREWLARQLDKRGIGYERYENTFLWIEDMKTAIQLCRSFFRRKWSRVFDVFARRVNPILPLIRRLDFDDYYWAIDACEVATDLMWQSRRSLLESLDDLFDCALRTFSVERVVRFLGHKCLPSKNEVDTHYLHARRPESRCLRHYLRRNWIKMYDKWSVLRVETVINNPNDFRVLRVVQNGRGGKRRRWMRMGKGIGNLWRYLEVGEAANRRYLEALADLRPRAKPVAELDDLFRSRVVAGRRRAKLNPLAPQESRAFGAIMAGEHAIHGFRNRDLCNRLYDADPGSPDEAKRRCARTSRLIAKYRGHGLVAKVPGSRLYRVTERGYRVMGAVLRFRQAEFPLRKAA
jgi:hypothetical protein